jgi:hypothetical protein
MNLLSIHAPSSPAAAIHDSDHDNPAAIRAAFLVLGMCCGSIGTATLLHHVDARDRGADLARVCSVHPIAHVDEGEPVIAWVPIGSNNVHNGREQ